mmetsp:Transcript_16806/g.36261  ORF Transcript_16806/g.36261 Transcript_16806/m.36261 type:complete len:312 (+) Transcript_16806:2953-3888(+)
MLISFPSFFIAFCTAPTGIPILSILKNFRKLGSSLRGGPASFSSPPPFPLTWLAYDFSGSISMMLGSFPSFCNACRTAGGGMPILSILKNLAYSSLRGGSESSFLSSFLTWLACDFSGSISATEGSFPSRSNACLTVSFGMPTLSIFMYFWNSGSAFKGGREPSCCEAARLTKRASNAAFFLFDDLVTSFSFIADARFEKRASNAAFLLSVAGSSVIFFCSASERLGSRSIMVTLFPSRSNAWMTDARGNPTFSILKYFAYSGSSQRTLGCASFSSNREARLANKTSNALLVESFVESLSFSVGFSILSNT